MSRPRILVVDDKINILKLFCKILEEKYYVFIAETGSQGLGIFEQEDIDLVVTDIKLPDFDGLTLLEEIKKRQAEVDVIVITAYGSVSSAVEAMKKGAYDYITKPFNTTEILIIIERALEHKRLLLQTHQLQREVETIYGFPNIVGNSPAMQQVYTLMRKVANIDTTVLILGESGTGKELVARAIHYNSKRRKDSFVPINCSAIPKELIESELFGYVRGAFTGAYRSSLGLIEEADGGTLFLDEIGELSFDLQSKINRVLQERVVRRVGQKEFHPVDVRIIAATNVDLQKAVKDGRFREDLFYRLHVYPIHIPPLRVRREDIQLLAMHFIQKYSESRNKAVKGITVDAIDLLHRYDWPGNVRELENIIERAVILEEGDKIQLEHLSDVLVPDAEAVPYDSGLMQGPYKEALKAATDQFIAAYLVESLRRHGGNVTNAAKEAGIERESFHRLMKKHRLKSEDFKSSPSV
jgi:DNA-binding NtrC family response regulator